MSKPLKSKNNRKKRRGTDALVNCLAEYLLISQHIGILEAFAAIHAKVPIRMQLWDDPLHLHDLFEFQSKVFKHIEPREGYVLEMVFARGIDNFRAYISDLLSELFMSRPQMLIPFGKVAADVVFGNANRKEMISTLVEQRVTELSHRGIAELSNFLKDRYKLDIFNDAEDLTRTGELLAMRNLIVHNRSRMSRVFCERYSKPRVLKAEDMRVGSPLVITPSILHESMVYLACRAANIDKVAIEKFGLKVTRPRRKAIRVPA